MPEKYVIHTAPVPNRFKPIAKSGIIAWEEGCLRCAVCVKQKCVYEVYTQRDLDPFHMVDGHPRWSGGEDRTAMRPG